jgi:hypothetical protein
MTLGDIHFHFGSRQIKTPNTLDMSLLKISRRDVLRRSIAGAPGLCLAGVAGKSSAAEATISAPTLPDPPARDPLRICFFTDSHQPGPHTHEHDRGGSISNEHLHYQDRVRRAFDKANAFNPAAYRRQQQIADQNQTQPRHELHRILHRLGENFGFYRAFWHSFASCLPSFFFLVSLVTWWFTISLHS